MHLTHIRLSLLLILLLPGAAAGADKIDPPEGLIGAWQVDIDKMLPLLEQRFPEGDLSTAKTMLGGMRWQFGADGVMTATVAGRESKGSFTITGQVDGVYQVDFAAPDQAAKSGTIALDTEAGTMLIDAGQGPAGQLHLRRAEAAAAD